MRRLAAAALASLALAAAGCGGDSGDDYGKDVREVGRALQESSVGQELSNVKSPEQLGDALRKAADLLDEAAADLDELDPPDEVADAHRKLTEGARETADAFRRVADQAETGSQEDVLGTLGRLTGGGGAQKLEEGLRELEKEGYEVRAEDGE